MELSPGSLSRAPVRYTHSRSNGSSIASGKHPKIYSITILAQWLYRFQSDKHKAMNIYFVSKAVISDWFMLKKRSLATVRFVPNTDVQ